MALGDLRDKAAIIGVGNAWFGKHPEITPVEMAADALRVAMDDAGLNKDDLDGLIIPTGAPLGVDYDELSETLGLNIEYGHQAWSHGRFLPNHIAHASMAVHFGVANYIAIVRASNWALLGAPVGGPGQHESWRAYGGAHQESHHYGMTSPVAAWAMSFRRYMDLYGATGRDLAVIAVAFRKHASLNPEAVMRKPITVEDHQNSRYICEPLRLYDYCLNIGGASAIILTSAERARDHRQKPVYVAGVQGIGAGHDMPTGSRPGLGNWQQKVDMNWVARPEEIRVFRMAGMGPRDIDFAFSYDSATCQILYALERFGFCKPGEAASWVQNGRIELGGELPMNTSGGTHSEAHISGWNHIVEISRQLRGQCGERQVQGAEVAMWCNDRNGAVIFHN